MIFFDCFCHLWTVSADLCGCVDQPPSQSSLLPQVYVAWCVQMGCLKNHLYNNHSPISRWWLDHANDGPSEATDFCEGFVDSCRFSLSSDVQLVAQGGKKVSGEDFGHFWSRLPQRLRATRSSNFRPLYVRCVALDRIQVACC